MHNIRVYTFLLIILITACYPAPRAAGQFTDNEFEAMAAEMAKGDTKDITVDQLVRIKDDVILLDSREKKEYDISHIPGAIWVGYDDFTLDRIKDIDKNAKIVVYCSVGYRSERIGEKIMDGGYNDISNLSGSIFKWVNEGYKIVDSGNQPTKKIHGFNKKWSKWVRKGEVTY